MFQWVAVLNTVFEDQAPKAASQSGTACSEHPLEKKGLLNTGERNDSYVTKYRKRKKKKEKRKKGKSEFSLYCSTDAFFHSSSLGLTAQLACVTI